MTQWVISFGGGVAPFETPTREGLGGKGAGLVGMTALGLPVPPGFILTTDVCAAYYAEGRRLPDGLERDVAAALRALEATAGAGFGDAANPLLVSVRSGAPKSMPGMLDTVLNLGLNDETVAGLADRSGDAEFAWDSYRRLLRMYGEVVLGLDTDELEPEADGAAAARTIQQRIAEESGAPFPHDPHEQLWGAVRAVLDSWHNPRASLFRRLHDLPDVPGTAIVIQAMVFGNAAGNSATGVAFTRDPSTGAPEPFGEYLPNAQGDAVVSGLRTPLPLTRAARAAGGGDSPSLEESMPAVFAELCTAFRVLERKERAMQDVEFTVERGRLWLLQTRTGVTSAAAALRIAADMEVEGLLTRAEALCSLDAASLGRMLHPAVVAGSGRDVLATGLPASPGAAFGPVVFSADEAEAAVAAGLRPVLVLTETHPRDIHGIHAAAAVLTSRGGATSHAAIVARGMGRPCVVGAGGVVVDAGAGSFTAAARTVRRGDVVTVDGASGEISMGELPLERPHPGGPFDTVLGWADEARRLGVRANADAPADVALARAFGAEGIGLFRTEYGFLRGEALAAIRRLLFADGGEARAAPLAALLPLQRAAYADLFAEAAGMPVAIRLLDLAPGAFLPSGEAEIEQAAAELGIPETRVRPRASALAETNPAFGHRGCRLAISWPDLYAVQVRAILEAALAAGAAPQILVPLVASAREYEAVRDAVAGVARTLGAETGTAPAYALGAMIELPRAVMQAARIAESAEFFSFGTNNLTQTVFGVSRNDAAAFLEGYRAAGLFAGDPFATLDVDGVGALLRLAVERGRAARPDLEIGICGEHGGDAASIRFFHEIGLDYVSVSPYRVPTARLAAAQVALSET